MSSDTAAKGWENEVIAFFSKNLPTEVGLDGKDNWTHIYKSTYWRGCDALVALGQADETDRGASPKDVPALPEQLPRWDDICVAVLKLATQNQHLVFRVDDGKEHPPEPLLRVASVSKRGKYTTWSISNRNTWSKADKLIDWIGRQIPGATGHKLSMRIVQKNAQDANPRPKPNIAAKNNLGPASADHEMLLLLERLQLVHEGTWTDRAEPIFWRDRPHPRSHDRRCERIHHEAVRFRHHPSQIPTSGFDLTIDPRRSNRREPRRF